MIKLSFRLLLYLYSKRRYHILIQNLTHVYIMGEQFQYWEACQSLHNMHSKWLDAGLTLAAFHMQSKAYDSVRPPSFGDHQHLNDLVLQRDREEVDANGALTEDDDGLSNESISRTTSNFGSFLNRKLKRRGRKKTKNSTSELVSINVASSSSCEELPYPNYRNRMLTKALTANCSSRISIKEGKAMQTKTTPIPSLFLQEGAHLVSLLSAVALSTLRFDEDDSYAPLVEFTPGHHWPNYNSDHDADMKKYGYELGLWRRFVVLVKYWLDISRTKQQCRVYNAARPLPVIGGISEREAVMLQRARSKSAKVALVFLWWNEFIIREQLHGSLGDVAPPIVSRLQQYSSDGHFWYNSARKMR